jgi:hypothetical protein
MAPSPMKPMFMAPALSGGKPSEGRQRWQSFAKVIRLLKPRSRRDWAARNWNAG